jgi:hypothetical protein
MSTYITTVLMWRCSLYRKQIVDSVIALFRVDFSGRDELAERQVFSLFDFVNNRETTKVSTSAGLSACLIVLYVP